MRFFPYSLSGEEQPWEDGEYWGENHDHWDTLEMFVGTTVCKGLYMDLRENLIHEQYCQFDWATLSPTQQWIYHWENYCKAAKPDKKGSFNIVYDTPRIELHHDERHPDDFGNAISTALLRSDALTLVPAGTKMHRVQWEHVEDELTFPRLTAPPNDKAKANRFSPQGVSLFYGARDLDTACLEIKAQAGDEITHAVFETTQNLAVLDFTAAQFPEGQFDYSWITDYHVANFLRHFLQEIRKEVKGEGDEQDYIPTQALCDFFRKEGAAEVLGVSRWNPDPCEALKLIDKNQRIDGICFRSSKGTDRTSYVLFYDHYTSADVLELKEAKHSIFTPQPTLQEMIEKMLNDRSDTE